MLKKKKKNTKAKAFHKMDLDRNPVSLSNVKEVQYWHELRGCWTELGPTHQNRRLQASKWEICNLQKEKSQMFLGEMFYDQTRQGQS